MTNGFPGEFLLLKSLFETKPSMALISGTTIILCAAYMLRMLQFSIFGEGESVLKQLNFGQWLSLAVIVALVLFLGIFPQSILDTMQGPVNSLIEMIKAKGVMS